MNPKYRIYVISKGRWKRRQTVKTLESMNVPYKIVVEPSEATEYQKVIDNNNIIIAPENFSEQGNGGVPVRNYVWNISLSNGEKWHWILDDNIESVQRFNNNLKAPCKTGTPFRVIEDFVSRYENISQAGMHYTTFCPSCEGRPPIQFNNRVYSCILIRNDTNYRWRGKFNEDTDLSLRMLKDGWCTVLFRAFLIEKRSTMCQGGGNTDTIYNGGDDRLLFAESLHNQHPDVVSVVRRFNRWHHYVDYRRFKHNILIRKKGFDYKRVDNNYNLKLVKVK